MELQWKLCGEVEDEHRQNQRQYAHTFHYANTICVCKAFWELPRAYRDGILLHEIGHLLVGPEGSEAEATAAAEDFFQVPIEYADSPYGRELERVRNMVRHGVRIINRQKFLHNPDVKQKLIAIAYDKHGQPLAYRVDMRQMRYFRIPIDTAELLLSTGQAREVPYQPFSRGLAPGPQLNPPWEFGSPDIEPTARQRDEAELEEIQAKLAHTRVDSKQYMPLWRKKQAILKRIAGEWD